MPCLTTSWGKDGETKAPVDRVGSIAPRSRRDLRRQVKRGLDPEKLYAVITMLSARRVLPEALRDHVLRGDWQGWRDCRIEPDWLLIYRVDQEAGELILGRTR